MERCSASLRALLSGVIDYAGLFPPASLSLDESIRNYARYRGEPESWMLGRFICPAAKLGELAPLVKGMFTIDSPLSVVMIGSGGASDREIADTVKTDLVLWKKFEDAVGDRARVDVFEVRLPAPGAPKIDDRIQVFFEVTTGKSWRPAIRSQLEKSSGGAGFKLRTGGVEAAAFPPVSQVAFAIAECRDRELTLKFTAGLHHPIRHFDKSVNARMHGFINVFVAGVLARSGGLNEAELDEVLADEDPASFRFTDEQLSWRDLKATLTQIESARRDAVVSFGSCSFDEPRQDLRRLGWL